MRQHARVLGICLALVGITTVSATTVGASSRTTAATAVAKPAGYSIASATFPLPNGAQTPGTITCPVKKGAQTVPMSGGTLIQTDSADANINSSFPTTHGWAVDVNNTSGAASQFTVYAVCAKKPKGYVQKHSSSVINPADSISETNFACPNGDQLSGGGVISSSDSTLVTLSSSYPGSEQSWGIELNNLSASNATLTMSVVCAKFATGTNSYEFISGGVDTNPAGQETSTEAECSSGLSVLGGGSQSTEVSTIVSMNASFPFTGGWLGDVTNTGSNSSTVSSSARPEPMATKELTLEEILIQLPETPRRLAIFTEGVKPAKLQMSPEPGEWSAAEVLAHLRACADVWGNNIVRIIREDKPAWVAVNPRGWIEKTDYATLKFAPSLRAFTEQRAVLMAALGPLPRKSWSRVAVVSGGAPTCERTVLYYAERLARHERAHVKQIGRMVQTLQV